MWLLVQQCRREDELKESGGFVGIDIATQSQLRVVPTVAIRLRLESLEKLALTWGSVEPNAALE